MKRTICILFVLILLAAASASADQHLEAVFNFPITEDGRTELLDLYEQEGKMYAVSTLFPQYAAETDTDSALSPSDYAGLLSSGPETILQLMNITDNLIVSWIEPNLSGPVQDQFTGELFEKASDMGSFRCTAEEIEKQFRQRCEKLTDAQGKTGVEAFVSFFHALIYQRFENRNPDLYIQSFDEGRYLTVSVLDRDDVKMTLSLDRSSETSRRVLVSYRENGRYYFRDTEIDADQTQLIVLSDFYAGDLSSYRSAAASRPLFTETAFFREASDQSLSFEYKLESETLDSPLFAEGSLSSQKTGQAALNATVSIRNPDTKLVIISISVNPLNRPVAFPDKQILRTDLQKESSGIVVSATANMLLLAAEIIPLLPPDYQKTMQNLLYP